jgi:hypothetical protein
MRECSDIWVLYREFADALTEVLAENAVGPARRGRLARGHRFLCLGSSASVPPASGATRARCSKRRPGVRLVTEGYDTLDLKEAKALLEALAL